MCPSAPNSESDNHALQTTCLCKTICANLSEFKLTLALAETSTGGLIANFITNQPGSSAFFNGSIVAYSYDSLSDILMVKSQTLEQHGAVSEATVTEMAVNVQRILNADIGLAICGITGPGGGTAQKPVGTCWLAISNEKDMVTHHAVFDGDRITIKNKMAQHALTGLTNFLESHYPKP